jgi:hypothetical protein
LQAARAERCSSFELFQFKKKIIDSAATNVIVGIRAMN